MAQTIDPGALAEGVVAADRTAVGRALTLVESTRPDHRRLTEDFLTRLLPHAGRSHRVGVTGVPGVGKSTFIEAVGSRLTAGGHRVAVLAVDPSSSRSGGSILGDKTRMARLAADPRAFIRPSPSSGTLGGVTRATRESIIVLEAAGHDVVIVETVGVGQSETIVAGMVDTYLVLMLAGAGDELQGIKKGVLELADVVAVNKADGDNVTAARLAAAEYRRALELLAPATPSWRPRVVTCSALTGEGLDEVWDLVEEHRSALEAAGEFTARRRRQQLEWMRALLVERLLERALADPRVARRRTELEEAVAEGR
ncbi:MAG: methylmalonyl Co-A mutase-associated GTPase MeaB, partial [Actinomyces sp.]